jgi:hypothetical protein
MTTRSARLLLPELQLAAVALAPLIFCEPNSARLSAGQRTSQDRQDLGRARDFVPSYDDRGLTALSATRHPYGAQLLVPGGRLGVMLKYRVQGGDWFDLY